MLIFDKYMDNELNILSSLYLKLKLKTNKQFRGKFEQYKIRANKLKQMFIINEAEKELRKDKSIKDFDLLCKYVQNMNADINIIKYLDKAFSN